MRYIYSVYQGEFKVGENLASFYGNQVHGLKWTTEPPTQTGWYWVYTYHEKFPSGPSLVEVETDNDDLGVWNGGDFETVKDYSGPLKAYWLGPLPVPEPPKDGE